MSTLTSVEICETDESGCLRLQIVSPDQFEIFDTQSGHKIGWIRLPETSHYRLTLYKGKGGFTAILTSPAGLKYFALPGSSIHSEEISMELSGQPIRGNPQRQPRSTQRQAAQRVTHQAMILGAGMATRFEPISGQNTGYSKPAVPLLGDRSVIRCIADELQQDGFRHFLINTYFMPDSLKHSLKTHQPSYQVTYIDEEAPSGTAGALRKILERQSDTLDQDKPLLIIQGDAVTDADFSEFVEAHMRRKAFITIGCQPVPARDVHKFGIIITDQSDPDGISGQILEFQEKPRPEEAKSQLANTGFYLLSPEAFRLISDIYRQRLTAAQNTARTTGEPVPESVEFDFAKHIFPEVLKQSKAGSLPGPFYAHFIQGYWSDIGNPEQYLETLHDIYAGRVNMPLPDHRDQYYENGIIYWPGTKALAQREGAQLQGNIIVALPFPGN